MVSGKDVLKGKKKDVGEKNVFRHGVRASPKKMRLQPRKYTERIQHLFVLLVNIREEEESE